MAIRNIEIEFMTSTYPEGITASVYRNFTLKERSDYMTYLSSLASTSKFGNARWIIRREFYINPLQTIGGNNYAATTINVPANVTMVFEGGSFTSASDNSDETITKYGTLHGKNTIIIASIQQIFDLKINITGSWIMDIAYPQWFGARNDYNPSATGIKIPDYNATEAINKAIQLKRVGEVFIPRGNYLIAETIIMKHGIVLKGEKAYHKGSAQNDYTSQGTALHCKLSSIDKYLGGYMMLVNIDRSGTISQEKGNWETANPGPLTAIKELYFTNWIGNLKGLLVGGGFYADFCEWQGFAQGIAFTNNYADNKTITDCIFQSHDNINSTPDLYTFDFGQVGDGLTFKRNAIPSWLIYQVKGFLRVNYCNGGEINDNIMNHDVLIANSKGVAFRNNHLEGERTQLRIVNSTVEVSGNFFEKGSVPSLRLEGYTSGSFDNSIVTLDNNLFNYYGTDYKIDSNNNAVSKTRSPYDIQMNNINILKINNSFRNYVTRGDIARTNPLGLMICDMNMNPFTEFNKHSYFLSYDSNINIGNYIKRNCAFNVKKVSFAAAWKGVVKTVLWTKPESNTINTYKYKGQIIFDLDRKIVNITGGPLKDGIADFGEHTPVRRTIQSSEGKNINIMDGVLITLVNMADLGYNAIIRLYREQVGSTTENYICDIPVCSSRHLYDDGIHVCGYPWKKLETGNTGLIQQGLQPVNAIEFKGDNIILKASPTPNLPVPIGSKWVDGDIIYNMSSIGGSNAIWICVEGNWYAK